MADLPMQHPRAPASVAQARARFFNSGNAFNVKLPEVPARLFSPPPEGRYGMFDCDQSRALGCGFPATTPLMLARYVRIAARDALLPLDVCATGSVWYVISGSGSLTGAVDRLTFGKGDVFLLPGAPGYRLEAGAEDVLLWTVGNEPQLAFERAQPAPVAKATIDAVHYSAAEIERQFALIFSSGTSEETSGRALIFSSDRQAAARNLTPTLTLSFNTLEPNTHQRTHRHNSAAITLVVQGEAAIRWWAVRCARGRRGPHWSRHPVRRIRTTTQARAARSSSSCRTAGCTTTRGRWASSFWRPPADR